MDEALPAGTIIYAPYMPLYRSVTYRMPKQKRQAGGTVLRKKRMRKKRSLWERIEKQAVNAPAQQMHDEIDHRILKEVYRRA